MLELDGLSHVVDDFDCFAVDQWGVLHDGRAVYPGVLELLSTLADRRKDVVIVTNSSKTMMRNVSRLSEKFGVIRGVHYGQLVSSAQLLRDWLAGRPSTNVHQVCAQEDASLFDDVATVTITSLQDAELVALLSVPDAPMIPLVDRISERGVTVITPSADIDSVTPFGLTSGLRSWVEALRDRGVHVVNFGKPERRFYAACDSYWSSGTPSRVLAVGDQLMTDVLGARRVGWSTVLVRSGAGNQTPTGSSKLSPDFVVPCFRL